MSFSVLLVSFIVFWCLIRIRTSTSTGTGTSTGSSIIINNITGIDTSIGSGTGTVFNDGPTRKRRLSLFF